MSWIKANSRGRGFPPAFLCTGSQMAGALRGGADVQVTLMAATTRLTSSKHSLMRGVLARRDAQLGRVEALLDKKLAGLEAAQRRAEARVWMGPAGNAGGSRDAETGFAAV
jgi:hypothetical protein